jgi:hypothetical protein
MSVTAWRGAEHRFDRQEDAARCGGGDAAAPRSRSGSCSHPSCLAAGFSIARLLLHRSGVPWESGAGGGSRTHLLPAAVFEHETAELCGDDSATLDGDEWDVELESLLPAQRRFAATPSALQRPGRRRAGHPLGVRAEREERARVGGQCPPAGDRAPQPPRPQAVAVRLDGTRRARQRRAPTRPASLPSSRGESHPPALTDPDVNLSIHPARAVQPTV